MTEINFHEYIVGDSFKIDLLDRPDSGGVFARYTDAGGSSIAFIPGYKVLSKEESGDFHKARLIKKDQKPKELKVLIG
jgi:hypothetical protein